MYIHSCLPKQGTERSLAVGEYFLEKARRNGRSLSRLKLFRLAYIAHGYMLAYFKNGLLGEEVEARPEGPVPASLYYATRHCEACNVGHIDGAPNDVSRLFSAEEKNVMNTVWDTYAHLSDLALSSLTRAFRSPWQVTCELNTMRSGNERKSVPKIPNDMILYYYANGVVGKKHNCL